jgi:hypothetical protein
LEFFSTRMLDIIGVVILLTSQTKDPAPMTALSFSSSGLLVSYHLGAAERIAKDRQLLQSIDRFLGASGGSLAAALLCAAPERLPEAKEYLLSGKVTKSIKSLGDLWDPAARVLPRFFEETGILPDNAAKMCSDRLFVSVTSKKTGMNKRFSQFKDNEDLLAVLQASCSFAGDGVLLSDGERYWDGGMSDALPILEEPGSRTITVCPFSSTSSISPADYTQPAKTYDVCGVGLHFSLNNIVRGLDTTFPRGISVVKSYFEKGYSDADDYLVKHTAWEDYATMAQARVIDDVRKHSDVSSSPPPQPTCELGQPAQVQNQAQTAQAQEAEAVGVAEEAAP